MVGIIIMNLKKKKNQLHWASPSGLFTFTYFFFFNFNYKLQLIVIVCNINFNSSVSSNTSVQCFYKCSKSYDNRGFIRE